VCLDIASDEIKRVRDHILEFFAKISEGRQIDNVDPVIPIFPNPNPYVNPIPEPDIPAMPSLDLTSAERDLVERLGIPFEALIREEEGGRLCVDSEYAMEVYCSFQVVFDAVSLPIIYPYNNLCDVFSDRRLEKIQEPIGPRVNVPIKPERGKIYPVEGYVDFCHEKTAEYEAIGTRYNDDVLHLQGEAYGFTIAGLNVKARLSEMARIPPLPPVRASDISLPEVKKVDFEKIGATLNAHRAKLEEFKKRRLRRREGTSKPKDNSGG
jgi:hypothetical protein